MSMSNNVNMNLQRFSRDRELALRVHRAENQRNEAWERIQQMQQELNTVKIQKAICKQNYEARLKEMSTTMSEWYEMVSHSHPDQFKQFQRQLNETEKIIKRHGLDNSSDQDYQDHLLIIDDDTDDEIAQPNDLFQENTSNVMIRCSVCHEDRNVNGVPGFWTGLAYESNTPTCGHLICGQCAHRIRECHICRMKLRGHQRVHFN